MSDRDETQSAAPETTGNAPMTAPEGREGEDNPLLRLALDFGPLLVFFVAFQLGEDILALDPVRGLLGSWADSQALTGDSAALFVATAAFMAVVPVTLAISYITAGHIPRMALVTALVVAVFGGLTLWLQDETFIKMKPTVVNGLFALVLGIGLVQGRSYIQYLLGKGLPLDDRGWMIFTQRWCLFFVFMALLNEAVWRTQSTEFWVTFRTVANIPITLVFMVCQVPLLKRHMLDEAED
ncbi:MAG: septation protein A [Pseudomonadota bacterium]